MTDLLSELEAVVRSDFLCPKCGHFVHTRG
jgi:predicted RNA-binding Zn-ribbon protein involved in translation (DUF1610 family)